MTKIKFGVDLGTTNSAITKVEKGDVKIVKSELQKDTIPSCIYFNKKKVTTVGDRSYNQLHSERLKALKAKSKGDNNIFIEFKRTMGFDKIFHSSSMDRDFNSEDLSAEVLKKLKSLETTEEFKSLVITVPAMFNDNQKSATVRAGEMAGFKQIELLQEPIAAVMAYGLESSVQDADILVFDFGGGTFDAALIKIEDGIIQVKDTEGDNWLGGKNLDDAIIHEILIPYLEEHYSIESYLSDDTLRSLLADAMKKYAEETKITLSFSSTHNILPDLGELPNDDKGEEMGIDIDVSHDDMVRVLGPVFQKAIDLAKRLLKRNNLDGDKLTTLLLVGGPTYSPVLREMLNNQICKPDTSVDPMTVVAVGAALYAAKFDISEEIVDEQRDKTKLQLELPGLKSHSVESELDVVVKINRSKTVGVIPDKLFVKFNREDGGFSTGKVEIDDVGEIIEVLLNKGKPNNFSIIVYDEQGSKVDAEPSDFTIFQGLGIDSATLPYNYGIEIYDTVKEKLVIKFIKGLEKNNTFPANGEKSGLKTLTDIRPGSSDEIIIPVYQGDKEAEDTRAINSVFVHTIIIKGTELRRLLPKGSEVNVFMEVKSDSDISANIEIPLLDLDLDFTFKNHRQKGVTAEDMSNQITQAYCEIEDFENGENTVDQEKINSIKSRIKEIKRDFESNKSDYDTLMKTRDHIRACFRDIDNLENDSKWPTVEKKLKEEFYELEEKADNVGEKDILDNVAQIKSQVDSIINRQDVKAAKELTGKISSLIFALLDKEHGVHLWISFINSYNDEFESHAWSDRAQARMLIDQGLRESVGNPSLGRMRDLVMQLWKLLPRSEGSNGPGGGFLGN